jgi:hypothetical protein
MGVLSSGHGLRNGVLSMVADEAKGRKVHGAADDTTIFIVPIFSWLYHLSAL